MSDSLYFDDITSVEVPVSIGGKKYVLREADGDAACKYRNALLRSTKLGPDGRPSSIDGMADAEPLLVSLCLFEVYDDKGQEKRRLVLPSTIRSWPARVLKALFKKVRDISDLEERETMEDLEKRIAEDNRKLALLNGSKVESVVEVAAKNAHSCTVVGYG